MEISYGKNFLNPVFEAQSYATQIPILQHQFLSQPISPLISSFLTPHQNRIHLQSTQSSCPPPSAILPTHLSPPQEYLAQSQVPVDVTRISPYIAQCVEHPQQYNSNARFDFKGKPFALRNAQESFYNVESQLHAQNLFYVPYFDASSESGRNTAHISALNDNSSNNSNSINNNNNNNTSNNSTCPSVPLPKISKSSFHVGYYVPPSVEPGDPYGGINTVWNQHFELLFRSFHPHIWSFAPTEKPLHGWSVYKDMAKVRFSCQGKDCQHGWTSMHGVVVFYYKFESYRNQGEVRFVLTGQKCVQCQNPEFETPMWYPEEAHKVMTNLYYHIASTIYMMATPPPIKDRRHGRPRQQHVASNCQGCVLGICKPPPSPSAEITSKSPS